MASNLRRKQFHLTVFDVRDEPVRELEQLGAAPAGSVAEVAQSSDIVITMLPGPDEVEATMLGQEGVLANGRLGTIVMDMSTVDPGLTDRLGAAAADAGLGMVDAPVGRLASHADAGESLFMVGGSEHDVQRVWPLLEAMGTTIYHCGPVGHGIRTKLVNNFLAIVSCQMNAEAIGLAAGFGLDLEKTLEVIHGTTATNGQLKINYASKVLSGDTQPGFTIDLAHKDLSLILAAANHQRVPTPIAAVARESLSLARSDDYGGKDFSALLDHWCNRAGIAPPRFRKAEAGPE